MTIKRAVAGLVVLLTIFFMITQGWDFPYARLFMLSSIYLGWLVYRLAHKVVRLEDSIILLATTHTFKYENGIHVMVPRGTE